MLRDLSTIEQALHNELGRRKKENIAYQTHVSKVITQNEDIKDIKHKIDAAYVSKQYLDQMSQKREQENKLLVE
jgi:hypothetical protein